MVLLNRFPRRLQRLRKKGWRMPEGSIYVGRPSIYGNPYKIGDIHPICDHPMSAEEATYLFEADLIDHIANKRLDTILKLEKLRGHDLLCWCREGMPCHGNVWLRWANR